MTGDLHKVAASVRGAEPTPKERNMPKRKVLTLNNTICTPWRILRRHCEKAQPADFKDLTSIRVDLKYLVEKGFRHGRGNQHASVLEANMAAEFQFAEWSEITESTDPYFWAKVSAYSWGWQAATVGVIQ